MDHFLVEASPTSQTAGQAVVVTVTAHDKYHNVVTSYNNDAVAIDVTQSGGTAGSISYGNGGANFTDDGDGTATLASGAGNFTNGVWSFEVTDTTAEGAVQITVSDGTYSGSTNDAESGTDITWRG